MLILTACKRAYNIDVATKRKNEEYIKNFKYMKGLKRYLGSKSGETNCQMVTIMLLFLFSVICQLSVDIWLGIDSGEFVHKKMSEHSFYYIYGALGVLSLIALIVRDYYHRRCIRQNVERLHLRSIQHILGNKLEYFSTLPSSRLIFRLTKD